MVSQLAFRQRQRDRVRELEQQIEVTELGITNLKTNNNVLKIEIFKVQVENNVLRDIIQHRC